MLGPNMLSQNIFSDDTLANLVRLAGVLQLSVLVASALVPTQLNWRESLGVLPRLYRQLFWTYGGYVVGMIIFLGVLCIAFPAELTSGEPLGRFLCGFIAIFWGVRLSLQLWFDVKPYLKAWWLIAGEVVLTALFIFFTGLFAFVAWQA